ncbi:MAG: L,D-transpeptidase [Lachnospiraceae bacterium]|nr:L,D-transpeptidase [Lachnospiraceae bacterium]
MRRLLELLFLMTASFTISLVFPEYTYAMEIMDMTAPVVPYETIIPVVSTDLAIPVVQEPAPAPAMTYIDISIDNQMLAYYVNGSPVLVTPCVTGKPGRSTPRGVFAINSCVPGKYLNGPTWHVWVDRWMRFCGNVGIHDANWRKQFGGEIYKSNGSHGCVNIPHDQAVLLYSMVGVGTPVIVH